MGVNKVIFGNNTILDLTSDTVTSDTLRSGYTAHRADGEEIIGSLTTIPIDVWVFDYNVGYIDNANWIYQSPTNTWTDIYQVLAGHFYFLTLGTNVGTRFRSMFTTVDVTQITSAQTVTGTRIKHLNNPPAFSNASFTAESDGYLLIAKDNVGKQGIKTYVYDGTISWP